VYAHTAVSVYVCKNLCAFDIQQYKYTHTHTDTDTPDKYTHTHTDTDTDTDIPDKFLQRQKRAAVKLRQQYTHTHA